MSRKSVHWRWFDKSKPVPAWLHLELSDDDIRNLLQFHHPRVRGRLLYYRDLWRRTPLWADREKIKAVYAEAHRRRLEGEDVVVDHVFPLHGALVTGLHVHTNLTVLDRRLNAQLSNKEYPGSPQLQLFQHDDPYFELAHTEAR